MFFQEVHWDKYCTHTTSKENQQRCITVPGPLMVLKEIVLIKPRYGTFWRGFPFRQKHGPTWQLKFRQRQLTYVAPSASTVAWKSKCIQMSCEDFLLMRMSWIYAELFRARVTLKPLFIHTTFPWWAASAATAALWLIDGLECGSQSATKRPLRPPPNI